MSAVALDAGISPRVFSRWPIVAPLFFAMLIGLLACVTLCQEAHAHATLTGTVPADGAILESAPEAVVLSFNEPASPITASLVRPGGEVSALDQLSSSGARISIGLPDGLGEGSYALSWRAVSEDGHPISGTNFFVVGVASVAPVQEVRQNYSGVAEVLWLARLVLFIGLFFGVGGAVFRVLAAELPAKAVFASRWAIGAGLVAAPVIVGFQGLDLSGSDTSGLLETRIWWLGLSSPYGATVLLATTALLLGLCVLQARSITWVHITSGLAVMAIGLAISASGHASAAHPQWLTRPALFLHVTAIAWWVGALFPLVLLLRQDRRVASPPLIRFSRAIPFAIMPLVVSGAILAVIQLGPISPAWWSAYGQILAAKLALLVILFAIASWNRWVLTGPAAAGDQRALSHMRRGIVAEIVIILLVLGLVSTWRFTPPPRALVTLATAPASISLADEHLRAVLTFAPPRVGRVNIDIAIEAMDGGAFAPRSVRLLLEPANGEIAPVIQTADQVEPGLWRVEQITIPLAGPWSVLVEVRVSDFELVKIKGAVEIAP